MNLYNILWFFLIYACIGWCTEVIYAAVCDGKFVNRGMLNGPVCPIYGFGVVAVILCLSPIQNYLFVLFVCSVAVTTALELATGFILEKFFDEKWWDYSDIPFNFHGYVCLKFSIMWGIACVFVMRIVHPAIAGLVGLIPSAAGIVLLIFFYALLISDFIITVITLCGIRSKFKRITEIEKGLRVISDKIGSGLSDEALSVVEKNEELKTLLTQKKADAAASLAKYKESLLNYGFMHRRMLKAFPRIGAKYRARVEAAADRIKTRLRTDNADFSGHSQNNKKHPSDIKGSKD